MLSRFPRLDRTRIDAKKFGEFLGGPSSMYPKKMQALSLGFGMLNDAVSEKIVYLWIIPDGGLKVIQFPIVDGAGIDTDQLGDILLFKSQV